MAQETCAIGSQDYVIRTVAGSDLNGDGGQANLAFVSILEGVCADSLGNVYLADADDNRIRRIDASGKITTFAGTGVSGYAGDGGPALQANLRSPYGLRLDGAGSLFIADVGNNTVRRVSSDGTISTVAQNLASPRNLAFDSTGRLYVSEFAGHRVSRIEADGTTTTIAGTGTPGSSGDGGPATAAALNSPAGITFDSSGVLYIADSANARVRKVTPDGIISTAAGAGAPGAAGTLTLLEPTGVTVDPSGNLYVVNSGFPLVFRMDPTGTLLRQLPGAGRDLFFAPSGNLLLVGQQHLETLYPDGTLTSILDKSSYSFGDGGPATKARFDSVSSIAVDTQGNIVVADAAFRRIRQIGTNGTIDALPVSDFVSSPHSISFDANGGLFIADADSIVQANGASQPSLVAAKVTAHGLGFTASDTLYFSAGNSLYSVSQPPASSAVAGPFSAPAGIATDSAGNIYLADAGGNRILKIFANGTVSTIAGNGAVGYAGDLGYATNAELNAPLGVYMDSSGLLWIADTGNNAIRTVDPTGIIRTVAGSVYPGFAGDGGPAAYARLSSPTVLTGDAQGNLYIADSGNRRVRELTTGSGGGQNPGGQVTLTHSATYQTGPIAGGEIVALFGLGIGPASPMLAQLDASGHIASQLGSTSVLFNGVAAPLYYVGANQINAEAPVEIAGNVSALVQVQNGAVTVASAVVDLAPYVPGLFTSGPFAAALNQDLTLNGSSNPAPKGSVIVLFGTGFGSTQPLDHTGVPAVPPLGIPLGYVTVSINGESAEVLFVGDAPGFSGLTQINARIPADVSGQAQVVVSEGATSSPSGVYIWVVSF